MSAQNERFMSSAPDSPRTRFCRRHGAGLICPCPQTISVLVQSTAKATNDPRTRHRPRKRFVCVHEQAADMFGPRQWPRLWKSAVACGRSRESVSIVGRRSPRQGRSALSPLGFHLDPPPGSGGPAFRIPRTENYFAKMMATLRLARIELLCSPCRARNASKCPPLDLFHV
jgi:hypothetical protein